MSEVDREIPVPRAAADSRASESTAGADSAMSATRAFEGSHKQTADINTEEAYAHAVHESSGSDHFYERLGRRNAKRTEDQAQSTDLLTQFGDMNQRQTLNNLATQALQNAIETANMVSKQAVRHSDLAIDRQWNVNETDYAAAEILRSNTFKDALAGAVAAAVAAVVQPKS